MAGGGGRLFWGGRLVPPSPVGSQRNRMTSETPISLAGKRLADFQVPSFHGLKSTLPSWQVGSLCSWLGFSVSTETVTLWPLHLSSTWPGWAACFTDPGLVNHRHISLRTARPTGRCLPPTHTPGSSLHTPGMGGGVFQFLLQTE